MISFYPGPSRVYDGLSGWVKEAQKKGVLSMNHRSEEFMALSKTTVSLLKKKLLIPSSYTVFFTSSATECWEIIAQSLVTKKSAHLFNGSFGEKWFDYTLKIRPEAYSLPFDLQEELVPRHLDLEESDLVCMTQNETSNGTQVTNASIAEFRKKNPKVLIAVDATSSMAGVYLDFVQADVWFASVQKCFGLPSGLALMICSPRAMDRAKKINERGHYNSLGFMKEMMDKWQTSATPNVLGIFCLMKMLEEYPGIRSVERMIKKRFNDWVKFIQGSQSLRPLIQNKKLMSVTVLAVRTDPSALPGLKSTARKNGLLIGEGYGKLKETTFRIANFPAIDDSEIRLLQRFLKKYQPLSS